MGNKLDDAIESIDNSQRAALREALAHAFRAGYMTALPSNEIRDGYLDKMNARVEEFFWTDD